MKFANKILLVMAVVAAVVCLPADGALSADIQKAPEFNIANLRGGRIKLDEHKGRVVYVDFWASWCGPCRKSFPFMEELQQQYADDLVVIAVNMDKNRDDAFRFLDENKATFQIGHDPDGKLAKQFGVIAMPSSFIIDRDGNIQEVHLGFKSSTKKKIAMELEKLL
jgi:thiol-disulfide isomerase/thioredoxin